MSERCERISFTLPTDIARRIRMAAAEKSQTISGWLVHAAEHQLRLEAGQDLLAEWEAELGPVTDAERAAIETEMAAAQAAWVASPDADERPGAAAW